MILENHDLLDVIAFVNEDSIFSEIKKDRVIFRNGYQHTAESDEDVVMKAWSKRRGYIRKSYSELFLFKPETGNVLKDKKSRKQSSRKESV